MKTEIHYCGVSNCQTVIGRGREFCRRHEAAHNRVKALTSEDRQFVDRFVADLGRAIDLQISRGAN